MKKLALGVVGIMALGAGVVSPAQAQLGGLGKLADKLVGKEVSGTGVSGTEVLPAVGNEKAARVSVLDKQTNRRQTLLLVVGQVQAVGTLNLQLTKCLPDYAATLGQDVAWLDVTENGEGTGRSSPWFSGWMFNTYPEVSTLDHPRYDIQLQGCGVKARQAVKASASAPVIESNEPVMDTETTNDAPVDSSSDPYYVPGVEKKVSGSGPAPVSAPVEAAPAAVAPAADTEAPAAKPEDQQDLHQMMDGTY